MGKSEPDVERHDATAQRTMPLLPVGPSATETDGRGPWHDPDRVAKLEAEIGRLQDRLRQSPLILDCAVDYAIITLDAEGCVTGWNAGARNITGYDEVEVVGRSVDLIFTAEDRASGAFAAELRRAAETGRATNERWHVDRYGHRFWASGVMMRLGAEEGQPAGFLNILQDRTELRAAAERRELLMAEMNHRIRNIFASIQAVAERTGRNSRTIEEFQDAFHGRPVMLAHASDVLIHGEWRDAALREMIENAVQAHGGEPPQIAIAGPAVTLPAPLAVTVSLAFHELATNAVKYGALSVPAGRVDIAWEGSTGDQGADRVDIVWREYGGPTVAPPTRRGFGSQLLERGMPAGGTAKLEFRPAGLLCHLSLPLSSIGHRRRGGD